MSCTPDVVYQRFLRVFYATRCNYKLDFNILLEISCPNFVFVSKMYKYITRAFVMIYYANVALGKVWKCLPIDCKFAILLQGLLSHLNQEKIFVIAKDFSLDFVHLLVAFIVQSQMRHIGVLHL